MATGAEIHSGIMTMIKRSNETNRVTNGWIMLDKNLDRE
jgi:hypothetical protein